MVMAPESVSVPPSAVIVAPPAPRVMAPDQVLLLARLRSAPAAATPVPMRLVMGSATRSPEPSISRAAPDATVVPPAVVPRAALDCTRITPAVMVVAPVYVLAPDRVRVPVPVLVRASAPLPSAATPEKVVLVLLPPAVRVTAPAAPLVTLPAPASEPIVSLKPNRSNVAPPTTVSALLAPTALTTPSLTVPALMVVAPVYVLAAERVRVPLPSLVRPPAPLTSALTVSVAAASVTVMLSVAAKDIAKVMVFVAATPLSIRFPVPRAMELPDRV